MTFIDDFSRYGYVYLISHKSEALERFKIFKTEVKKQLGKVIKIVSQIEVVNIMGNMEI